MSAVSHLQVNLPPYCDDGDRAAGLRGWLHSRFEGTNYRQFFPTLPFTAARARFRHPHFLGRCSRECTAFQQGVFVFCRPLWASQRVFMLLLRHSVQLSRFSQARRRGSSVDSASARCRWAWRVTTRWRARPPLMLTVQKVSEPHLEWKVLRGSGEFGVFSRTFFVKGDARVNKDVPLPVEFDLQAALSKAKAVGPSILGVVLRGKGLGLRNFESVVGQVHSEEESKRFIGERWEATNLPLSWSQAAVQAFLAGWPCTVEASFRAGKTIIRSAVPPLHRRLQHDFGCSLIRPAGPRKRQNAQVLVWSKKRKTAVESQKAAKSWASVVRGHPTPPVTAKRPLAGSESTDTTALGAITPTQVQDNNQGPTQVSLSPRSQRLDTLQPPQSPVLADVVAQLQVLMESIQSIATTVGQGGQLHSLQAEVTVMKNADNEDDEFEEHDGFSSEFGEREGVTAEALGEPKFDSARLTPY